MVKNFRYIVLGGITLYVATFLFIYNVLHSAWSADLFQLVASLSFVFVQIIWFFIVLNHAITLVRLAYYRDIQVRNFDKDSLPTISIIIPIYEEPRELVDEMANALNRIIYPREKLEVIIVDDSDAKTVVSFTYGLFRKLRFSGITLKYIWRIRRSGFRGGALNIALKNSKAQYIVVLDIDHVPLPCMLWRLASAIMKSDYDILMFPQEFKNWNKNSITLASYIGYKFDYAFSRKGKSVTNSAFCVGTNWIGDKRKIIEAGGFVEESIVEDMATSMLKWHPYGLKIGMIDEILAHGLVPETIESFKKQQYRWSKGAFDLFWKYLKISRKLTPLQVFDYGFSIAWYLVGLTLLLSNVFPVLSILGANFLLVRSPLEYLINVVAYTFLQLLLYAAPLVIVGEPPLRVFKGQAIGIVVASSYIKALLDSMLGRKSSFETTPKTYSKRTFLKLLRESALPLFLLYLNCLVIIVALAQPNWKNYITAFWAFYNLTWLLSAMYNLSKDLLRSKLRANHKLQGIN